MKTSISKSYPKMHLFFSSSVDLELSVMFCMFRISRLPRSLKARPTSMLSKMTSVVSVILATTLPRGAASQPNTSENHQHHHHCQRKTERRRSSSTILTQPSRNSRPAFQRLRPARAAPPPLTAGAWATSECG